MKRSGILSLIFVFVMACSLNAAFPSRMNYQGKLFDPTGAPINGKKQMTFILWNGSTSSAASPQPNGWANLDVNVINGLFSVLLPVDQNQNPFLDSNELTIKVVVEGETLTGERFFDSVPYAFVAGAVGNPNQVVNNILATSRIHIGPALPTPDAFVPKLRVYGGLAGFSGTNKGIYLGESNGYASIQASNPDFSAVDRLAINPYGGDVGIGVPAPGAKLHVGGPVRVDGSIIASGGFATVSDKRLKKDIKPLDNILQKVLKLRGVTYLWKAGHKPAGEKPVERNIGFIAQEIEKVFPELVMTDKNGYKLVNYDKFSPILLQAIKEQQKTIVELEKKNKKLLKELEQLNKTMDKLVK
jgi:hypothetical protein